MKIVGSVFLCIFVFFGLVFWLGISTIKEPIIQSDQANQTTEPTKIEYPPNHTALTRGFNRLGTFIHDFREEIVAVGTLFIAVFTIILAFATGFLYVATRDLVKGTEESAKRQLRAYVHIDDTRGPDLTKDCPYWFEFFVKNGGKTPAYAVRQWTGFTLGPYPLNQPLPSPTTPPRYAAIVNADGRVKVQGEISQYSADEVMRIQAEDTRLYVFGRIIYRDVFGSNWETNFRMMYGGRDAARGQGMLFCEEGNDST